MHKRIIGVLTGAALAAWAGAAAAQAPSTVAIGFASGVPTLDPLALAGLVAALGLAAVAIMRARRTPRLFALLLTLALVVGAVPLAHALPKKFIGLSGGPFPLGSSLRGDYDRFFGNDTALPITLTAITVNNVDPDDWSPTTAGSCTPGLVLQPGDSCELIVPSLNGGAG